MYTHVDVIIVGAGLAGTYVALNLPSTMKVLLLSAKKNNSSLAQGGIASCIDQDDAYTLHIEDTLIAGHHTNNPDAVTQLIENGPKEIQTLIDLGVQFDATSTGHLNLTLEGGHSSKRILHINGDQTGKALMESLNKTLLTKKHVQHINNASLIRLNRSVQGLEGIDYEHNLKIHTVTTQFVVIATGGIGDIYRFTTNQKGAVGAGIAIANSADVQIENMRYVQFHPTAYWNKDTNKYFLMTEALRGEGAYLVDEHNHRFMPAIHKDAELAPRDIVSQAIFERITLSEKSQVFLDTRHLESTFLEKRFPSIYAYLMERAIQLGKDLVPIAPVAHYTIGGITIDLEGKTSMERLYACGEVASSGVHGANRLASNSLLECLVYGHRVADSICQHYLTTYQPSSTSEGKIHFKPLLNPPDYKTKIQRLMTQYAGILRTDEGLIKAKKELNALLEIFSPTKYTYLAHFHLYNITVVALMVIKDALSHSSLGCHQKEKSN